jgi:hypothetical protein
LRFATKQGIVRDKEIVEVSGIHGIARERDHRIEAWSLPSELLP